MQPKYLFFSLAPTVLQQFIINCQLIVSLKVKAAQPCSTPFTPWMNSPGQNTGVGSLSFLQGIFPTQGLNPGLLHYRQIPYHLSHQGRFHVLVIVNKAAVNMGTHISLQDSALISFVVENPLVYVQRGNCRIIW